ncbi:MAG: hypothetical protein EBR52_01225 [Microbacteriaceae bacterium]|nr:hypothetical protein [Microbacteriaceae bacterium]
MQLGTRWTFGTPTPARLTGPIVDGIASVEAQIRQLKVDASSWRWTVTWLEGRPVCELDDGTLVTIDANGVVTVTDPA